MELKVKIVKVRNNDPYDQDGDCRYCCFGEALSECPGDDDDPCATGEYFVIEEILK